MRSKTPRYSVEKSVPSRNSLDEYKKQLSYAFGLGFKSLLALGAILIFIYLFFFVQFFPFGLAATDTALFFAISVGFAFLHFLFLGVAWYAMRWIVEIPEFKNRISQKLAVIRNGWKRKLYGKSIFEFFDLLFSGAFSALFSIICLATLILAVVKDYKVGLALAVSGFLVSVLLKNISKESNLRKRGVMLMFGMVFSFIIPPLLAVEFFQKELKSVLEQSGIRNMNVAVALNEENYAIVRALAEERRLPIFACQSNSGKDSHRLITGVDVLWYGVGDRALLAIPLNKKDPLFDKIKAQIAPLRIAEEVPSIRVDLKRDGVVLFRGYKSPACIRYAFHAYFPSGSDKLTNEEKNRLKNDFADAASAMLVARKVNIVGGADLRAMPRGSSNYDLALARAESVKSFFIDSLKIKSTAIQVEGGGVFNSSVPCSEKLSAATLAECLSSSRRVDIEVDFE